MHPVASTGAITAASVTPQPSFSSQNDPASTPRCCGRSKIAEPRWPSGALSASSLGWPLPGTSATDYLRARFEGAGRHYERRRGGDVAVDTVDNGRACRLAVATSSRWPGGPSRRRGTVLKGGAARLPRRGARRLGAPDATPAPAVHRVRHGAPPTAAAAALFAQGRRARVVRRRQLGGSIRAVARSALSKMVVNSPYSPRRCLSPTRPSTLRAPALTVSSPAAPVLPPTLAMRAGIATRLRAEITARPLAT